MVVGGDRKEKPTERPHTPTLSKHSRLSSLGSALGDSWEKMENERDRKPETDTSSSSIRENGHVNRSTTKPKQQNPTVFY